MHYYLESSQADRINFDEMVERGLEAALNALDKETAMHYATQDAETFIGVQWDADSTAYDADSVEYAEDMGMIYVEDMAEAEARYYAVGRGVLKSFAANNKKRIAVQYSTDGLFGSTDPDEYDEAASVAGFGSSLENYLSEAYPDAEIAVSHGIGDSIKIDGLEDHEETPWIEQIVEKCWNGDDWLVGK